MSENFSSSNITTVTPTTTIIAKATATSGEVVNDVAPANTVGAQQKATTNLISDEFDFASVSMLIFYLFFYCYYLFYLLVNLFIFGYHFFTY